MTTRRATKIKTTLWAVVLLWGSPGAGLAQVLQLSDLNTIEYRSLDREETVLMMPIGVIEEHGPYLPLLTDSYISQWLADRVANAIVREKGWDVVTVPSLPIGVGAPGFCTSEP